MHVCKFASMATLRSFRSCGIVLRLSQTERAPVPLLSVSSLWSSTGPIILTSLPAKPSFSPLDTDELSWPFDLRSSSFHFFVDSRNCSFNFSCSSSSIFFLSFKISHYTFLFIIQAGFETNSAMRTCLITSSLTSVIFSIASMHPVKRFEHINVGS